MLIDFECYSKTLEQAKIIFRMAKYFGRRWVVIFQELFHLYRAPHIEQVGISSLFNTSQPIN